MGQFVRTALPNGVLKTFRFTNNNTYSMISGQLYLVQETVGVAFVHAKYDVQGCKERLDIDPDEEGILIYNCEKIEVEKVNASGHDFLPGDKVYWSGAAGAGVTPVYQSGYYWIGIAVAPSGAGESLVVIDLLGDKASLTEPL